MDRVGTTWHYILQGSLYLHTYTIPSYAEIMENYPNAELQIQHSKLMVKQVDDSYTELSWTVVKHSMHQNEDGQYVAVVLINHFTIFKSIWNILVGYFFPGSCTEVETIKGRCQVFMSQKVLFKSQPTFCIAVLYCTCPHEREPVPDRYKYELAESGLLDLKISHDHAIHYIFKFNLLEI